MLVSPASTTYRRVVEDVLGRDMTREVWTGNYPKALPVSLQPFDLSAVLPAVFYMFRFGKRRGRGTFAQIYGGDTGTIRDRRRLATIEKVADRLASDQCFGGFDHEIGKAILGDMLLSFCLENANHQLGRKEPVQRVAPAHYLASWVDLPDAVAHLRYVPEMLVAMLADQDDKHVCQHPEGTRSWFAVGRHFADNVLLEAFHKGIRIEGERASRTSDRFDETASVGLDQLLMIRLAQQLGAAPDRLRGSEGERISNQRPIAEKAAGEFSEDIRRFLRSFANVVPRHSLVDLMESCVAVGLTCILTSVTEILLEWASSGEVLPKHKQRPAHLFVDCSNGIDRRIGLLAEQSFDDFTRRLDRLPVILMVLRLLDWGARYNPVLRRTSIRTIPYATEWIALLGDILFDRHPESGSILNGLHEKALALADKLSSDNPEVETLLGDDSCKANSAWRLAEGLSFLMSKSRLWGNLYGGLDGFTNVNRPNGLAAKRRIYQTDPVTGKRTREIRSLVLTDSVLDYLVHLHVLRRGNKLSFRHLSFKEFVQVIEDRYGFCVDAAPPGMAISNDLLRANRAILERRLRDLGLLVGVNDAEAMKHLRPRFQRPAENEHGMD
jgi:hypothetical protein